MKWQVGGWLVFIFLGLVTAPEVTLASVYRIDGAYSQAHFIARLFWFKRIEGRFQHIDGEVLLIPGSTKLARVEARIAVHSVQMNSNHFRHWLLGPEFFDAKQFPTISFFSQAIAINILEHGGKLRGNLTLRGVSRTVEFNILPSTCMLNYPRPCLIKLRGTLRRSDYGMTAHRTAVSDQINLGLTIALYPNLLRTIPSLLPSKEGQKENYYPHR